MKALNCTQGQRYLEIAEADQSQEEFLWGWLDRVEI
ncbi:putative peptidoglycan-binding domain-containing protein [Siccibacter colletis]